MQRDALSVGLLGKILVFFAICASQTAMPDHESAVIEDGSRGGMRGVAGHAAKTCNASQFRVEWLMPRWGETLALEGSSYWSYQKTTATLLIMYMPHYQLPKR